MESGTESLKTFALQHAAQLEVAKNNQRILKELEPQLMQFKPFNFVSGV